jgi:hypothetical protein
MVLMMRLSLAVLAVVVVCAGACGSSDTSSGGRGGSGGSGGFAVGRFANGAADGTIGGGAGAAVTIGPRGGQGGGQGGGPGGSAGCNTSPAACACDSQASQCQSVLMTTCLGQHCPPSLDDAMLVANWSLGSASGPAAGRAYGAYNECDDGGRSFRVQQNGAGHGFSFDASGRLAVWYTFGGGTCSQLVCGKETSASSVCSECQMFSDPQPAGTFLVPRGQSNGPVPNCEVDAYERWSMPRLAPAN